MTLPASSSCQHKQFSWSHQFLRDPHFPWGGAGSALMLWGPGQLTSDSLREGSAAGVKKKRKKHTYSGFTYMTGKSNKKATRCWLTFWSGAGVGIGSSPPPGIRLGTGVVGAKSDKALASSGIFPAGQKEILVKAIVGLFSLSPLYLHN